jgi:hypothetical protein
VRGKGLSHIYLQYLNIYLFILIGRIVISIATTPSGSDDRPSTASALSHLIPGLIIGGIRAAEPLWLVESCLTRCISCKGDPDDVAIS